MGTEREHATKRAELEADTDDSETSWQGQTVGS